VHFPLNSLGVICEVTVFRFRSILLLWRNSVEFNCVMFHVYANEAQKCYRLLINIHVRRKKVHGGMSSSVTRKQIRLDPTKSLMGTGWEKSRSAPCCSEDKWHLIVKVHRLSYSSFPCCFNHAAIYSSLMSVHPFPPPEQKVILNPFDLTQTLPSANNHVCLSGNAQHS
jgi:hypothetical protein